MNEADFQDKPVEGGANEFSFEIEELKDFGKTDSTVEETTEPQAEEVSTPTETKDEEKEIDYKPLLDNLSKNIKYMDEEVKIDNIDDVIKNYQKGLNHDRLQEKLNSMENSEELTYIRGKAKEAGMTTTDYIKAIKNFEEQQERESEQTQYNELIEKGLSDELAKSIIENNRLAKEYQKDKARRQEEEKAQLDKQKKDAEYDAFVKTYPDVDVKAIPPEVIKKSGEIGLLTAYTMYQNEQLRNQLNIAKTNKENETKSPIKGTTEHGGVVTTKKDDFLAGLGLE